MVYTIKNSLLKVDISTHGGELQSICTPDGTEYLWQGDSATWPDQAPNLFPYIARLTNGTYMYNGDTYQMGIHGFLKDSEMTCERHTEDTLVLHLEDSENTRKQYPFSFLFVLTYALDNRQLKVTYTVKNKDNKTMYFGLGGHPGFCVPLDKKLCFNDYYLQFEPDCHPQKIIFSEDCFLTGQKEDFTLDSDCTLSLKHILFDNDALIFSNAGNVIQLKSNKSDKSIEMEYSDFEYLGLWHYPRTEVDYICIEPWSSLPSRKGIVEHLEQQDNLLSLESGSTCTKSWSIHIQ